MAEQTESKVDLLKKKAAEADQVVKKTQEAASGTTQTVGQPLWTPQIGLQLSYSILIFGLIVLVLMSVLVAKYTVNINRILRAFALVLIIVAAVFLIVAGYDEKQIAPVMGLLGTIAGYLLGSRHSSGEIAESDKGDGSGPDSPNDGTNGPAVIAQAKPDAAATESKPVKSVTSDDKLNKESADTTKEAAQENLSAAKGAATTQGG